MWLWAAFEDTSAGVGFSEVLWHSSERYDFVRYECQCSYQDSALKAI